jgi:superfamily II DNA or RNA helicase
MPHNIMTTLEALKPGLQVSGILPNQSVTLIDVQWHGRSAVEVTYKRADGNLGNQLLFRDDEANLTITEIGHTWQFDAAGSAFKMAAEAYRIHLAHLFDPVMAVHTSLIEPLPHQITAVYGEMLPRQPLRYLLADDPGSGKTIMAGLFIKELMLRGDVRRCLICAPGSLAAQWQDELLFKFHLHFDVITRESFETAASGNPFLENDQAIIRLDQIARSDELKRYLSHSQWDLVIVDEAHKMSASFWGGELKITQRYRLGELLGTLTRHLLLMTATPHNGKEEDFQLFLALLDPDRFENRSGSHSDPVDVSDIMRRMVKEDLRRFDGRPLFPERRAHTVGYILSPREQELYNEVTTYVREEFNRAEQLGDDRRRGTVGFALTVLQRRLASSPAAIYHSLVRRRERLKNRLQEVRQMQTAFQQQEAIGRDGPLYDDTYWEDFDDVPAEEAEEVEELILDSATASLTITELEAEIETLRGLIQLAYQVFHSGNDRKWEQLATLLQDDTHMLAPDGRQRKLVVFTEHRDTLNYLRSRITTLFGRDEHIVHIDGSLSRKKRRGVEDRFRNDPDVHFLLATDAAGEGINLQRAHLMVNYDLPWNPNRLEQRFGRIHRIGQTEVCHLWNLVANDTREGYVYERLLRKLETESQALDGQVFNVLGRWRPEVPLRQLLIEAVRYGDRPDVRAKLDQAVDQAVDKEQIRDLLESRSLATQTMDVRQIERIRADMERYAARRLQPFYIKAFFLHAFSELGGRLLEREPGRYRVSHVPAAIRHKAEELGTAVPVLSRYDRISFEKEQINVPGKPQAEFICPGHPLLDAVIALVLAQHRPLLRSGTLLIDTNDPGQTPRMLFFLDHMIRDAAGHAISREVHFVEIDDEGEVRHGGYAPYLDYRSATPQEVGQITDHLNGTVAKAGYQPAVAAEKKALTHAVETLVPHHLAQVRERREKRIDKTLAAVQERLIREINYWDGRAAELRRQEKEGRPNARLNSQLAQRRADELADRLAQRKQELLQERQLSAAPPVVIGGVLVIPAGLLYSLSGEDAPAELMDRRITEALAMQAVMEAEIALGNHPRDVSQENLGYDIESLDPGSGRLRFIEVKGRKAGADTVTITRTEILSGINSVDQFILALVEIENGQAKEPRYVRQPFNKEPDFDATSVNYNIRRLLAQSSNPY